MSSEVKKVRRSGPWCRPAATGAATLSSHPVSAGSTNQRPAAGSQSQRGLGLTHLRLRCNKCDTETPEPEPEQQQLFLLFSCHLIAAFLKIFFLIFGFLH